MKTEDYVYFSPPFSDYNVAQSAVVPHLDKDVNLVVSFRTAVGKTVLAEGAFAYHLSQDNKCKVAYCCPYRSLSHEKYESWSKCDQLSKYRVLLSNSDHNSSIDVWSRSRLAVITNESFDAKTRNSYYDSWVNSLGCVVFDEAHILGASRRGASMEASLMRFCHKNKKSRLIFLSATMSNGQDVARWIKKLNGKETKFIQSNWRPNKVAVNLIKLDNSYKGKIENVLDIVERCLANEKTIIFVHSKNVGNEISNKLSSIGIKNAFHNASLKHSVRNRIEKDFNDENSGLNILISTSTLSAGVNIG